MTAARPSPEQPGAHRPGTHRLTWLDVFAEEELAGNPLAVVHDADGVDDDTMLAFARETGLSETTFVQSATATGATADGRADYRNRIWTIAGEIPFAGHPSLGTAVAVAIERGLDAATFTQETGAGMQQVEVARAEADGSWRASVHQEAAEFGPTFKAARLAPILGLEEGGVDSRFSSQVVSTGFPTLLVPVADLEALARCRPDPALIGDLGLDGRTNLYPFVLDVPARSVRARCFAVDVGGFEDPATGSAAGPLVAYLQDILDIDRITVDQGVEMGRPGRLEARMESGRPRVGGLVREVIGGEVRLP